MYVEQSKDFVDPHILDDVYKLKRALYDLKQAPKAWYDRLTAYLVEHGFKRGFADTILFIRNDKNYFVVAQIYVDVLFLVLLMILLLNLLQKKRRRCLK